jgi:hypothetical protein
MQGQMGTGAYGCQAQAQAGTGAQGSGGHPGMEAQGQLEGFVDP